MPAPEHWSPSMMQAWQYAVSAVEHGIRVTEGRNEYRAGGGAISNEGWGSLYHLAEASKDSGELVQGLPFKTPIPSQAYTVVDIGLERKYTVVADISYIDQATKTRVDRVISVQSDDVESWADIEDHIDYMGSTYGVVGDEAGVSITRARFYMPASKAG